MTAVSPTPEEAAETVREALDADDSLDGSQIAAAHVALDSLVAALRDARREREGYLRDFLAARERSEQAEREREELARRMHLILTAVIYSTHGFVGDDGEIDTAAKFRAIERLARIDWNEDGTPRG